MQIEHKTRGHRGRDTKVKQNVSPLKNKKLAAALFKKNRTCQRMSTTSREKMAGHASPARISVDPSSRIEEK
jgi:hypothetical protein